MTTAAAPPAAAQHRPRPCEHGNPACRAVPTRPYVCGPRCAEHQPARTHPYHRLAAQ
ncbi:hypothetical protein ACNYS0_20075 [Streptomyces sp. BH034]|uniref:hypothetical protein n=1 Tax=Streptomyces sp. BH034 TaxID=3402626 RepID=UPI003BB779C3